MRGWQSHRIHWAKHIQKTSILRLCQALRGRLLRSQNESCAKLFLDMSLNFTPDVQVTPLQGSKWMFLWHMSWFDWLFSVLCWTLIFMCQDLLPTSCICLFSLPFTVSCVHCPCVFKSVFFLYSLLVPLCLLCSCACSLVLLCPLVSL